jgi:hypothetical protein
MGSYPSSPSSRFFEFLCKADVPMKVKDFFAVAGDDGNLLFDSGVRR